MRIPPNKIYRAFPELDRFSDEQCERFMQRVRVALPYRSVRWVTVSIMTCAAVIFVIVILYRYEQPLHRYLWLLLSRRSADTLILASWLLLVPIVPIFVGLLTRDIVLRTYLRKAVQMQLDRVRCRSCKYVLIGQRLMKGIITCPECGAQTTLQILGVTADDLLPPQPGKDRLADAPLGPGPAALSRRAGAGRGVKLTTGGDANAPDSL